MTDTIIVTTQEEMDAAIANESIVYGTHRIEVRGTEIISVKAHRELDIWAYGSSTVIALESAIVRAYDSSTVFATDSTTVTAYDSSTVFATDSATVWANDLTTVWATNSATVLARKYVAVHRISSGAGGRPTS